MTCEYLAHQEGVLQEDVILVSESKEDASVRVRMQARVMGECHGSTEATGYKRAGGPCSRGPSSFLWDKGDLIKEVSQQRSSCVRWHCGVLSWADAF